MIGLITTAWRAAAAIAASTLINALIMTGVWQMVLSPETRAATPVQDTFLALLPQSFTLVLLKTLGAAIAGPTGRFIGFVLALVLIERAQQRRTPAPVPVPVEAKTVVQ